MCTLDSRHANVSQGLGEDITDVILWAAKRGRGVGVRPGTMTNVQGLDQRACPPDRATRSVTRELSRPTPTVVLINREEH